MRERRIELTARDTKLHVKVLTRLGVKFELRGCFGSVRLCSVDLSDIVNCIRAEHAFSRYGSESA